LDAGWLPLETVADVRYSWSSMSRFGRYTFMK
jgi:hypothetical protein